MNRAVAGMTVSALALVSGLASAADAPARPIRVLVTYGGHGFEEEAFFRLLSELPGIECTKAPLPAWEDRLGPGLEDSFDVLLMYDMSASFPEARRERFVALLRSGIGLVSWHHNLCAHRDWPEFRRIIGGKYIFGTETIDGTAYEETPWAHDRVIPVRVADADHPITRGMTDFSIPDETYGRFYVSPDVRVLLTTDRADCNRELAWVHRYGNSPVCYLMLGHDSKAWAQKEFRVLLTGALRWAAESR